MTLWGVYVLRCCLMRFAFTQSLHMQPCVWLLKDSGEDVGFRLVRVCVCASVGEMIKSEVWEISLCACVVGWVRGWVGGRAGGRAGWWVGGVGRGEFILPELLL